jgi:hypothetical protein
MTIEGLPQRSEPVVNIRIVALLLGDQRHVKDTSEHGKVRVTRALFDRQEAQSMLVVSRPVTVRVSISNLFAVSKIAYRLCVRIFQPSRGEFCPHKGICHDNSHLLAAAPI